MQERRSPRFAINLNFGKEAKGGANADGAKRVESPRAKSPRAEGKSPRYSGLIQSVRQGEG